MASRHPHLELRPTGYHWRRRIPASVRKRYKLSFLCLPLRTHVLREAAGLANRITAISELCFLAEPPVSPEVMTEILVTFTRLEIEAADRLRALTGPRTRVAADAAMALEVATRASLHDAIYLCDKSAALGPVRNTAQHLGITLDETTDDFSILCDKMMRVLIDTSHQKQRRANGDFGSDDAYVLAAIGQLQHYDVQRASAVIVPPSQMTRHLEASTVTALEASESHRSEVDASCTEPKVLAPGEPARINAHDDREIDRPSLSTLPAPEKTITVPEVCDAWFKSRSLGEEWNGYEFSATPGAGQQFLKNADTTSATLKIISSFLADLSVDQLDQTRAQAFNEALLKLPKLRNRSAKQRERSVSEVVSETEKLEKRQVTAANAKIKRERLSGDEAEQVLDDARIARLDPTTIQKHQRILSAALDFGTRSGLITQNPFKRYVYNDKKVRDMKRYREDTSRQLWGNEFDALLATRMWTSKPEKPADPVYWLPIIARLHGMREEEILQLKPSDIRYRGGIPYFFIQRGFAQSVKTDCGKRCIPLHSQIIELGCLELVERKKNSQSARIFSCVNRSKSSKASYAAVFTKRFNYYRRSVGVYQENMDFHALRTTFHSGLVEQGVADTARCYLMGHNPNKDEGVSSYLPEGFPLAALKTLIELQRINIDKVIRIFGNAPQPRAPRLAVVDGEEVDVMPKVA